MATTDVESTFVDTNILIYANLASSPENGTARTRLEELVSGGSELWISRQVLREYIASLTRPQAFTKPISPAEISLDIRRFESQFEIAEDGPSVTAHLLDLLNEIPMGGKQIHDANIVATMLVHGIKRLLTHNVADFRRFASFIEVIPLVLSS
jgi:predicted nucleic acid-binding protein